MLFLVILSCGGNATDTSVEHKTFRELKRVLSPDKRVEAVLIEAEGDATVANSVDVFIVLPRTKVTERDLSRSLFTADHYREIDIQWRRTQLLRISYEKARIFRFTNFWHSEVIDNWNYIVEISLSPASDNNQLN